MVTAEIVPPGGGGGGAKAKVVAEWIRHFAISEPIALEALKCVSMRPLAAKPTDALRCPMAIYRFSSESRRKCDAGEGAAAGDYELTNIAGAAFSVR